MFPTWRLQLRDARRAVADGRWDEAAELLLRDALREFLPAKQLSAELAGRLVERARTRLAGGQSQAGWRDLNQAARLGAGAENIAELRRREAARRLACVAAEMARGDVAAAQAELTRMERRDLGGAERCAWQQAAAHLDHAEQRAAKGDVAAALAALDQARRSLPHADAGVQAQLDARQAAWAASAERVRQLDAQLHAAVATSQWTDALAAAEGLLELAPQHATARQARRKAWQAVGLEVTQAHRPGRRLTPLVRRRGADSTHAHSSAKNDTVTTDRQRAKRFVAWIDAVGGYLVCLGDEIVLGQPSEGGDADVPLLADLSRRHAVIRRESEAYVLVPLQRTAVDGKPVDEPTLLRNGSIIRLGDSVEMRFRKPHVLSGTAVLELVSRHKTEPAVNGIVLMAESCILGPQSHSHVRCPAWSHDLVMFRRGEDLWCRTAAALEIDGAPAAAPASVVGNCRMESDEFSLSLEEL